MTPDKERSWVYSLDPRSSGGEANSQGFGRPFGHVPTARSTKRAVSDLMAATASLRVDNTTAQ
jgi:hypothetical protein